MKNRKKREWDGNGLGMGIVSWEWREWEVRGHSRAPLTAINTNDLKLKLNITLQGVVMCYLILLTSTHLTE